MFIIVWEASAAAFEILSVSSEKGSFYIPKRIKRFSWGLPKKWMLYSSCWDFVLKKETDASFGFSSRAKNNEEGNIKSRFWKCSQKTQCTYTGCYLKYLNAIRNSVALVLKRLFGGTLRGLTALKCWTAFLDKLGILGVSHASQKSLIIINK